MSTSLSFVSFSCFVLLSLVLPTQCDRTRGPILYLILWILVINLSNGVTASVSIDQSNSNDVHWCDIASDISYGAPLAIVLSCLSLVFHYARSGPSHDHKWYQGIAYFTTCVGLPFFYMLSYSNVRNQRFLVVESYGCGPSTSSSILSLALVSILPLMVCIAALALTVFAILVQRQYGTSARRTGTTESTTWRYLLLASLSVVLIIVSSSLSLVSIATSGLTSPPDWTHEDGLLSLTELPILQSLNIVLSWWNAPVISIVACLILGSDLQSWRVYRGMLERMKGTSSANRNVTSLPMVSTDTSSATPVYDLRSGWDDTFRAVPSAASKSVSTLQIDTSYATLRSHPRADIEEHAALDSFAESTMTYVGSPTGRRALASSPCAFSPPRSSSPPALIVAPPTPTLGPSPVRGCVEPILRKGSDGQLSAFSTLSDSRSLLASSAWPTPPAALPTAPFASYRPDAAREVVPRSSIRHARWLTARGVHMTVEQRLA